MKHNTLNESLNVYGNNYLEKRRTTRLLTGHIPSKEKGDSTLELQDDKSEESLESDHDSEFDAFAEELDSIIQLSFNCLEFLSTSSVH